MAFRLDRRSTTTRADPCPQGRQGQVPADSHFVRPDRDLRWTNQVGKKRESPESELGGEVEAERERGEGGDRGGA